MRHAKKLEARLVEMLLYRSVAVLADILRPDAQDDREELQQLGLQGAIPTHKDFASSCCSQLLFVPKISKVSAPAYYF